MQKCSTDEAFVRRRVDADHEVIPLLDHVDGAIFRGDFKPDIRYFSAKPAAIFPTAV
jgi:hypothetical protein